MPKQKVAKLGGSSVSDHDQISKVKAIVKSDSERRFVIVSAPGARWKGDVKVTDLLYRLHAAMIRGAVEEKEMLLLTISERFREIAGKLRMNCVLAEHLKTFLSAVRDGESLEYIVSRGEYLSAVLMAATLNFQFIDAADVFVFSSNGKFDPVATKRKFKTDKRLRSEKGAVIPGFYGADRFGRVHLFSRGGSDITGAIVAAEVGADVYENWTDVSGILSADPRIIDGPQAVDVMSYRELRELTYMGANVFHDEAMFFLSQSGIPINIRNTNRPTDPGTLIVSGNCLSQRQAGSIVGIAGKKNFSVITVEKMLMNEEIGYVEKICAVLRNNNVSFEHMPGGIDTLSIVVDDHQIAGKSEKIILDIQKKCCPDKIFLHPRMALICTVGHAMAHTPGVAAKLLGAVANENINIRMIDQGSSELSIIIGVNSEDFEPAIRTIYKAFFG